MTLGCTKTLARFIWSADVGNAYLSGMRKKRVLWEVRVLKASAVFIGTVYAPDEKTARKAALKELTVRPVDQNRLLIRRAA
jgi:hypothetical protein